MMQRERMGEGYFEPATTFQPVVSKTLRCPSRAPLTSLVLFEASERDVTVFWWFLSKVKGFAATRSRTEI